MPGLRRKIATVRLRLRLQQMLEAATLAGVVAAGLACAGLYALRIGWLHADVGSGLWIGVAALMGVGALAGALRPVSSLAAARALDRANDLDDRISTALVLNTDPDVTGPGPWVAAIVRDAERAGANADVRRASPWRQPRDLRALGLATVAVMVSWALFFPSPDVAAVEIPPERYLEVPAWELTRATDMAERLHAEAKRLGDPSLTRSTDELRRLWEDVAAREVDKEEAFARLAAVAEKLEGTAGTFDDARAGLRRAGKAMEKTGALEDLGRALDAEDFASAREELEKLATALRDEALAPKEMRSLSRTVADAAKALAAEHDALEKRLESLRKDVESLESKETRSDEEERKLKRKKDELEKLEEELEAKKDESKMLERLSRDLEEMSEMLKKMDAAGASGKAQSLADELGGMEEKLDRADAMEKLKKALAEGRVTIASGKSKQKRDGEEDGEGDGGGDGDGGGMAELKMRRFMSGSGAGVGVGVGAASSGGSRGADPGGSSGKKDGSGDERASDEEGEGTEGAGADGTERAESGGSGEDPPKESGPGGGDEGGGGGEDPGEGAHGSPPRDSRLGAAGFDELDVPGKRSAGPVRTRIMLGAARKGFSERGYEKLYEAAAADAEESMDETRVPLGYRVFVRRYMEAIRPR